MKPHNHEGPRLLITFIACFYSLNLRIETSPDDKDDYVLESEDGLIVLTILSGGGEFDIHHDDGGVNTQGAFKTIQQTEHVTKLVLVNGSAKVNLRADDARIRLAAK